LINVVIAEIHEHYESHVMAVYADMVTALAKTHDYIKDNGLELVAVADDFETIFKRSGHQGYITFSKREVII
jgi:hypothetical protein